jgi:hypothetical protein
MEDNWHLTNKKALFLNLTHYYKQLDLEAEAIPLTFHIKSLEDPEFQKWKS